MGLLGTKLRAAGITAAALVVAFNAAVLPLASATPPSYWDWQGVTPDSWSNLDNYSGPMIWGQIYDSEAYGDGVWFGGRDAEGQAALWRYDTVAGTWANAIPSAFDVPASKAITALLSYNGTLYFTADSNSKATEVWAKTSANGAWTKIGSGGAAPSVQNTYGMTGYNGSMCLTGRASVVQVWCYNTMYSWYNLNIGSAGAQYENNRSSKPVTALNGAMFVDARAVGGYNEIWRHKDGAWTMVQTPFTDESRTGEETAHYIKALTSFNDNLVAIVQDDSQVNHVWQYNGTTWSQLGQNNYDGDTDVHYNYNTLGVHDNKLLVGAGTYGVSARVLAYDAGANEWIQKNPNLFGMGGDPDEFKPNFVTSFTSTGGVLYATTGAEGEGAYFPQVWRTPQFVASNTSSGNGGSSGSSQTGSAGPEEAQAPNNGDANNDGTPDDQQTYVTSYKNPVTNKYVSLAVDAVCQNSLVSSEAEAVKAAQDAGYNYPGGLLAFTTTCGTNGFTATVNQYYYGLPNASYVARKYIPANKAYTTIPGASTAFVTIDAQQVLKVTYKVTDGGNLDLDGVANGVIVDPAGPGVTAISAPNTGVRTIQDILFKHGE